MDKKKENEKKANYIKEKLSQTKIDRVYWPVITDVILRRQMQFDLSDEHFKRDVDTFQKNVNKIIIKDLGKRIMGQYSPTGKKILINSRLFEAADYETIFEVFCHECSHAMNFEKNGVSKEDRTFNRQVFGMFNESSTMEMFTESEAQFMTDSVNAVHGYESITGYANVISAAFGVRKNDLLKRAIEGRKELNTLLNRSEFKLNINRENAAFNQISFNIGLLHAALMKKTETKNTKNK